MVENTTVTVKNKVAYITFESTHSNAMSSSLLQKLTDDINTISKNEEANVIVLKSNGDKVFCAGANLKELLSIKNLEEAESFFGHFATLILAMITSPKIIIGSVQGKAVGGGVGIIGACDYVFATEKASVRLSEVAIGIGPFVIEPVLSKKMGQPAFMDLTLNPNEWKEAKWCVEKGLFTKIVNEQSGLYETVATKAESIAAYSKEALAELKKVFWKETNNWEELFVERQKMSAKLLLSSHCQEVINKILKVK